MKRTDEGVPFDLIYGQVESMLARVLDVKGAARKILVGRLRHLRTIGVPELPRPGSGQRVAYTKEMAFEMLLALALENIGQTPRIAADLAKNHLKEYSAPSILEKARSSKSDLYIVIEPAGEGGIVGYSVFPSAVLFKGMKQLPTVCSIINMTELVTKFDEEYAVELTTGGY